MASENIRAHIRTEIVRNSEQATDAGSELASSRVFPGLTLPPFVLDAGRFASHAYLEFFTASLRCDNTRRAYRRAVDRFLAWCQDRGLSWSDVSSPIVSEYINKHSFHQKTGRPLDTQSKKQHLAALRHFYDVQERRHGVLFNPAAAVRGPRHRAEKGKTRPFQRGQVKKLLESIDTSTPVGQRDRAVLAVLYWTACRAGAAARLTLGDFFSDGQRWWFSFGEKGGRPHTVMAHHTLQVFLMSYLQTAGIGGDPRDWPLFRSARGRTGKLSAYRPPNPTRATSARGGLTGNDVLRIVKRRLRDAGLPADTFTAHSFRATTATELRRKGVPREKVQYLLGHSSSRTTELYDHSHEERVMEVVDQISL